MKRVIVAGTILLLAGCSVNRQAEISSLDAPNGIVRLDYGQAVLQNAWSDEYVNNGTAVKVCQGMALTLSQIIPGINPSCQRLLALYLIKNKNNSH